LTTPKLGVVICVESKIRPSVVVQSLRFNDKMMKNLDKQKMIILFKIVTNLFFDHNL